MSLRSVGRYFLKFNPLTSIQTRHLNCQGDTTELSALVLGVYGKDDDPYRSTKIFTKAADEYDKSIDGRLGEALKSAGPIPRLGEVRLFYKLDNLFTAVAVAGIGDECLSYNDSEQIDELKEAIRNASAYGSRTLQEQHMRVLSIDPMGHAESAAEGSAMAVWMFQELKTNSRLIPKLELYNDCDFTGWQIGLQKASAQNLARQLSETPANMMTPIGFAQAAVEILAKAGVSVEVKVRDWSRIMNMEAFLAASKGSCEPPIFLEIHYYGCDPDVSPAVLVGKGVTFDSGGLCLHSCEFQKHMRGDMSGAAAIVGAVRAASALKLPINIRGLIPLYENLPGSCAMKPGDIYRARNGKTIIIHNTDYDGRMALADALSYAGTYNPKFITSVGTFSKELIESFGEGATAVFSNNDELYEMLRVASIHTGDRIWRMPLWNHFTGKVMTSPFADVRDKLEDVTIPDRIVNSGMPPQAAAFLKEFVPNVDWIHLDTYGVMTTDGSAAHYLRPGMSGRPTRTIIEFLAQLGCITADKSEDVTTAEAALKCANA